MRSASSLGDFLRQLDIQKPSLPNPQNLFDPPANIFYSILQMYNKFKKQNETQILQNKIYALKISDPEQQKSEMQIEGPSKPTKIDVTIKSLCLAHPLMDIDSIENLLKMKEFLPHTLRQDVFNEIISQIKNIEPITTNHFESIFKVFKSIIKSEQYFKCGYQNKNQFWTKIQRQIMEILLKANIDQTGFNKIAHFMMCLPGLDHNSLLMIAELYKKVTTNEEFQELEKVYWYISNKLDDNDPQITELKSKTMVLITSPKNLQILRSRIERGLKREQKQMIVNQAKSKMSENFTILTNKIQNIIQFIFMSIQLQNQLWIDFLTWLWKLPQICKQYVVNTKLPSLVESILRQPFKKMLEIIELLHKNQNQYEVSVYFVESILVSQQKFLINKKIRKFVALKIMVEPTYKFWQKVIEGTQLIDLLLEMIKMNNAYELFRHVLEDNAQRFIGFESYLCKLYQTAPVKVKDFYLELDQSKNSKIFGLKSNYLIHFLGRITNYQLFLSILRGISEYEPSQNCIVIISKIFTVQTFTKTQNRLIKHQVIRTLNIILCNTKYEHLNEAFKLHLKEFSKKIGDEYKQVFDSIPKEMLDSLTTFYKENSVV